MTSEQAMLSGIRALGRILAPAMATVVLLAAGGCDLIPKRKEAARPETLASPYPAPKLWAVAPFRNESGTTLVDGPALADRLTHQLEDVRGVRTLPVNRVIAAMETEGLSEITSQDQALALAEKIGADGLIVGTVTAWDPYEPPKIGAAIQLYSRSIGPGSASLDPQRVSRATTSDQLPGAILPPQPVAQAGGVFDAANGNVRHDLRRYAHGRAPADSPAGWRRYLLSTDLYSEFVSHQLVRQLLGAERQRLQPSPQGGGSEEPAEQSDAGRSASAGAETDTPATPPTR